MRLKRLERDWMLKMAGVNPAKMPPPPAAGTLWAAVMYFSDDRGPDKSPLAKSVQNNVDDVKKRSHYLQMVDALFQAASVEDFCAFFDDFNVTCKVAHSFKFNKNNYILHELKSGSKDRLYIYVYTKNSEACVLVLESLHKNQRKTPQDIKDRSEDLIKKIVNAPSIKIVK